MRRESTPPVEDQQIRCPRLGHQISFSYCRHENRGLPCFRIIQCWYDYFLIEEHLREELTPQEWEKGFDRGPTPKIVSLLDLIEQAKKNREEG